MEAAFGVDARLVVNGRLEVSGTESDPILLTAINKQPGGWGGIVINGVNGKPNLGSRLEYATVEYGGKFTANLHVIYAGVALSHAIIRQSATDGVSAGLGAENVLIESSQIVDNVRYGVNNLQEEDNLVMAAHNWWGSATGPTVDENCNDGGTGSKVSANVSFYPFLTAIDEPVSTVAPTDLMQLSIAPQRWYAPADGVTRVEVIITLRSGEGNPVAGREVFLHSTLGTILDGGITNGYGEARARIHSSNPGDAIMTASVEELLPCSNGFRSGTSTIHFTDFAAPDLRPGAAAPYMDGALRIAPQPDCGRDGVQRGGATDESQSLPHSCEW